MKQIIRQCVDGDAIYAVGEAWKIDDAGDVDIRCF